MSGKPRDEETRFLEHFTHEPEDEMQGSMDQVKNDIARLGSQFADVECIKAGEVEEISAKELEILTVQLVIQKETPAT